MKHRIEKIRFQSSSDTVVGNLYTPSENYFKGLLILHGGGQSNKDRFEGLQEILLGYNIASFSFDFPGIGESSGNHEDDNLNNRLDIAESALNTFIKLAKIKYFYIAGFSMGGHIAARLSERNKNIAGLIFSSAAAYGKNSENKNFDGQFTKSIREPNSWEDSPVFSSLQKFKGKVLVIYGEHDNVIPHSVKTQYISIGKAKGKSLVLKNGQHNLFVPTDKVEEVIQNKAVKAIIDFINPTIS